MVGLFRSDTKFKWKNLCTIFTILGITCNIFNVRYQQKSRQTNRLFKEKLGYDFQGCNDDIEFDYDMLLNKSGYGLKEEDYIFLKDQVPDSHIDVIGCDTDACVIKIAMDLFDRELDFSVLGDKVYSTGGNNYHNDAIGILKRNIGTSLKKNKKLY